MHSEVRGSLERHLPRSLPTEDELFAMRRRPGGSRASPCCGSTTCATRSCRQAIVNEATRIYGRREVA